MYFAAAVILLLIIALYIVVSRFFAIAFLRDDREKSAAERLGIPWTIYVDDVTEGEKRLFNYKSVNVQITSFDGLKLRAMFIPYDNARGTVIMMHGYRSDGYADFSTVFEFYRSMGFNILLPHQRSHLTSEGRYITFGILERYDCRDWAEYVADNIGGDIYLLGVSMGAATVMLASELGLPDNVRGIIADCGYSSPWDELSHVLRRDYGLPPFPLMNMVNHRFRRIVGRDLRSVACTEALSKATLPVMFIHGSSDDFVPCDMTYKNYKACRSKKSLYISDGADHAVTSWTDPQGYRTAVRGFILKTSN